MQIALGTVVLKAPNMAKSRVVRLMVDGEFFGEICSPAHVLLPVGRHSIALATVTDAVCLPIEIEISPHKPVILEYGESRSSNEPFWLRHEGSPSKDQSALMRSTRSILYVLAIAVVVIGALGLMGAGFRFAFQYIPPPSSSLIKATEFWNDVTTHGEIAPEAQAILSPDLIAMQIDWSLLVKEIASFVGANAKVTGRRGLQMQRGETKHVNGKTISVKKAMVRVEISGDQGSVFIQTFVTKGAGDSELRISGFDIGRAKLDIESHSQHSPNHPRPNKTFEMKYRFSP